MSPSTAPGLLNNRPMDTVMSNGRRFTISRAVEADVAELAALLADDVLGATRESVAIAPYLEAFGDIDADPNQLLLAVRDESRDLVATMQLTIIPCLARGGAKRLQIEAVRIAGSARGAGLGTELFAWAHEYGRTRGARLVQLTTDKARTDAQRFYDRLGYEASHEGYKRPL